MSEETTRTLVRRHLDAWRRGDVEALLADYSDDVVTLSAHTGALIGKDEVERMYQSVFVDLFPPADTTLDVTAEVISGGHALIQWTARTSKVRTVGGFDVFQVRDGKIVSASGGCDILPLDLED
jgi:uncharacterized protein (TIGR02246 family)